MVTRKRVEYCLCSSADSKDNDFRFQTPIRRCKPECFPVMEIKNSTGSNEGYLFQITTLEGRGRNCSTNIVRAHRGERDAEEPQTEPLSSISQFCWSKHSIKSD